MYRRNSVIAKDECCEDTPISSIMHINGRYPQNGKYADKNKDALIYVMRGSGMVEQAAEKTGLSAGSVMYLKKGEPYYLKGQFSVYVMDLA